MFPGMEQYPPPRDSLPFFREYRLIKKAITKSRRCPLIYFIPRLECGNYFVVSSLHKLFISIDTSRVVVRQEYHVLPCDRSIGRRRPAHHRPFLSLFSRHVSPNVLPWWDTRLRAKSQPPHSLSSLPPYGGYLVLQLLALLPVRMPSLPHRRIVVVSRPASTQDTRRSHTALSICYSWST